MRRLLRRCCSCSSMPRRRRSSVPNRTKRSEARTTQRNGTRDKLVATTAGDITVAIPKVRSGVVLPVAAHPPRRRVDVACTPW